jgi:hypothetical protein
MKKWSELPVEIQEKMLEHQEAQTGKRNESVFEKSIGASSEQMGFNWGRTSEGLVFWIAILENGKFDLFYELYPKEEKKDKWFPLVATSNIHSNLIVCFFGSENEGILLTNNSYGGGIGYHSLNWGSCFNQEEWTIIAQPSEYPKEMYVSDESEEVAFYEKNKQTILAYSDSKLQYVDEDLCTWFYAVDIPEEEPDNVKPKNFYEELKEYFKNTPKDKIAKDWAGAGEYDETGVLVEDFLKLTSEINTSKLKKELKILKSKLKELEEKIAQLNKN